MVVAGTKSFSKHSWKIFKMSVNQVRGAVISQSMLSSQPTCAKWFKWRLSGEDRDCARVFIGLICEAGWDLNDWDLNKEMPYMLR